MTQIKLFNTFTRKLENFEPLVAGQVGLYGCGPTVYNFAHIGNLRAYIFDDTIVRVLRYFGFTVNHVMNITDVGHLTGDDDSGDDKMLRSAHERGKSVLEIAQFYTDAFFVDLERLNIVRPSIVCKATEHIADMIALIQKLETKGYTYTAGGNVYFDVSKFPRYGELARLKLDELREGARVAVDHNKKSPFDFVLWFTKSKFEQQALVWDSPWGKGYPGWHIECSAMSMRYLGESFDIHAGGIDHIPIHHTNEIAQSEAVTGKTWVRYWLHNEFLVLGQGKMSKSSGEFLTLQSLLDRGYEALDYRYFLLGGHYRSQLQFSFEALDTARSSRHSLNERVLQLREKLSAAEEAQVAALLKGERSQAGLAQFCASPGVPARARELVGEFENFIAEDFNTPRALAALWGILRDKELSPFVAIALTFVLDSSLGLGLADLVQARSSIAPEQKAWIEERIAARAAAKKAKDFALADSIRAELKNSGVSIEDSATGTTWKL